MHDGQNKFRLNLPLAFFKISSKWNNLDLIQCAEIKKDQNFAMIYPIHSADLGSKITSTDKHVKLFCYFERRLCDRVLK